MEPKRKGIFGGTFDPIHNGHLYLAKEALNLLHLDKLIFVPSGNPPHKKEKQITEASIRYELVKEAIKNYTDFQVDSYEINKDETSYTYKTINYFNQQEKDTEWFFLTGSDCLYELHSWKNVHDILEMCKFVVFNRPGYNDIYEKKIEAEKRYKKEILVLEIEPLNISSSMVREKAKNDEDIRGLVPVSVYEAIKHLNLYKEERFHVE